MRYLGGKASTAGAISRAVLAARGEATRYLEPFVGSGAVLEEVAPHFKCVYAGDAMPGLAGMWICLINGWTPPTAVSEERYRMLKSAPERLPERVFVGFGASFAGKFFGGYARPHVRQRDPYGTSVRVALRRARAFPHARLRECDYRCWNPGSGWLVYCDPPYAGTTGYSTGQFKTAEFWSTCQEWARAGATVFVSEYQAPRGVECVLEIPRQSRVRRSDVPTVVDRLFRIKP